MQTIIESSQPELFHTFEYFPGEQKIFKMKEDLTPSQHAEKYRVITKSRIPGPCRSENNMPVAKMFDIIDLPHVRKGVCAKGVQTGVTEGSHSYVGYRVENSGRGDVTIVMPDEKLVRRIMKRRVVPMFEKSPRFSELLSDNPDDTSLSAISLKNGINIGVGWSNSQAVVSSDAIETLIVDEFDKCKDIINIEEAFDRVTTYQYTSKTIVFSTPGLDGGPITQEMDDCDVIFDYYVECLDCHVSQIMVFSNFYWPEEATHKEIKRKKLARYCCPHCESLWDDYKRDQAVIKGDWIPRENIDKPIAIGFQFPSWISPFKSLSDVVARKLKAETAKVEKPKKIRMWYNQEAGESHDEVIEDEQLPVEKLYERCYPYAPKGSEWRIPMKACILTCSVDIQGNRLEAELMAWGPGLENWGIEKRVFMGNTVKEEVWDMLEDYIHETWKHESGVDLSLSAVTIDMSYRDQYALNFMARPKLKVKVYPVRGASTPGKPLLSPPLTKKKIKKGTKYSPWLIGTENAKDTLFAWARAEIEDKEGVRFMHFPDSYDYEFFKGFLSETLIKRYNQSGKQILSYKKIKTDIRNEPLDLRVYNLIAIIILTRFKNVNLEILSKQIINIAAGGPSIKKKKSRILSKGVET